MVLSQLTFLDLFYEVIYNEAQHGHKYTEDRKKNPVHDVWENIYGYVILCPYNYYKHHVKCHVTFGRLHSHLVITYAKPCFFFAWPLQWYRVFFDAPFCNETWRQTHEQIFGALSTVHTSEACVQVCVLRSNRVNGLYKKGEGLAIMI